MSRDSNLSQTLGIDLIQAAKNELEFLKLVDDNPNLCKGSLVKNAIRRYELFWLPFASRFGSSPALQAAPLDIAWVWHVHMLAPFYYEQDCLNIVSTVLDHAPLNTTQRNLALQLTRDRWYGALPGEPFEVDLTKPPTLLTEYRSRIQYNLEEACYRQFKFYYQVSLPHYSDDLFLKSAAERYEHHVQLKRLHPDVSMVPCYDVQLIWHAHQLHPLNYKQTTTELFGTPLHQDVTGRTPGSNLYRIELKTRSLWEAAGERLEKAGAMYRGDPPDPSPPAPKSLYTLLACQEYSFEIQKVEFEAVGLKRLLNFVIQMENLEGRILYSQTFKGVNQEHFGAPKKFTIENGAEPAIIVSVYKWEIFRTRLIEKCQVDLLPYVQEVVDAEAATVSSQPITIDVPFCSAQYTVKLTLKIDPPSIIKHCFKVQPMKKFVPCNHPSMVLSFPELMLSPSDLAKVSVPCDSSTHPVLWRGYRVFRYRVVHSSEALLSALEIINLYDQVVATSHTISPGTFPERSAVEDQQKNIVQNENEGERAMLIRGNKDWGVCIGKLTKTSDRGIPGWQHYVAIKVYKLFGDRGWCSVRKLGHGVFAMQLDPDTTVQVDLKLNTVIISPRAQNIPQILALAFSVSVLHLLCIPYVSHPSRKSSPSSQTSPSGFISPSIYSAGYLSSKVPTNVCLSVRQDMLETSEERVCHYDFNEDLPCGCNDGLPNVVGENVSDEESLEAAGCGSAWR
ncbi:uncharacterized protein LOC110047744 [Orbicella faveolata]|uniref:uncharacterized protein LOC110047743 n=1 Tax=Orbicella faveolata TaxID=48498 RepID=UPI0009E3766C|nr:uncharacterized protein LOC110047743 [Orbicella faveolata]XP_020609147.1 uncharacterized protein LOC110047743 [Orbicella faveolata]XP_020609148.1 uncharacterized protein LOC110047744 [Orbicella faveolata]XP_020609149.1 uncharacterized protein LOC110047744 [Orbicella faveolata]